MFITLEQIKAARALLKWTQKDLAKHAGLNDDQVQNFEASRSRSLEVLEAIHQAFTINGIEFTDGEGVKKKSNHVYTLQGRESFIRFFDDIYKIAKTHENPDICVTSVDEAAYEKWLGTYEPVHMERMSRLNDVKIRVLVKAKDTHLTSTAYCKYRWVSPKHFAEVSLYIYGDKVAFIEFSEDNVVVTVVDNKAVTEAHRKMFELAWDSSSTSRDV